MTQYTDPDGMEFTANTQESADTFSTLIDAYMGFRPETGEILKALLKSDPEMPMALCAKGYFAKLIGSASHSQRAVGISEELANHIDVVDANPRERLHAQALSQWCQGQLDTATDIWEQILLSWPMDGMAVRLSHFTHFYSGDGRRTRDSIARVLPQWPTDHRNYGFLLGMYGFGLEEAGEYVQAEHYARMAVDRNQKDSWSIHAAAHVMEMTGRHAEGIRWIAELQPHWSTVNNFRFHLYWHQCLFHIERGEFDAVLSIYDEQIVSDIESEFYLDICNASSLLWRLEMCGIDIGDRWRKLACVSNGHVNDTELVFVSLHYLMALVSGGHEEGTQRMMKTLRQWSTADSTQGKIIAQVGLNIAEGLLHFRRKEYVQAMDKIQAVRYSMDSIGGSKAQRDVFQMIMLDAAQSSGDVMKARALFTDRVSHKDTSSWSWQGYSQALLSLGQEALANEAARKAGIIRGVGKVGISNA
ncbi:MAG: tetratricopeptide repeat protein [Gammaproteobacteria bacterium]|nr:tetratricopeptide repeat protein [Gammaproteobacteria bacterium]